MCRLLGGLAVAAWLTTSEAAADDLADEADLQFELGRDKYQAGEHRSALEHFLASNRLVPNKNVVFNIARCYEHLKQYPEAYRYYAQSLALETEGTARERLQGDLARIAGHVAVLDIVTDPPGATIFLDRRDLGSRGNAPRRLGLSPGRYRVIVEAPGYESSQTDALELKAGESRSVSLKLTRILGTLQVLGESAGALVHLGEEDAPILCRSPCSVQVPPGRHSVWLTREGFQSAAYEVEVTARGIAVVHARLNPLRGGLVVNTDERDALVEVDGRPVGFTPSVLSVQVGLRRVRVSLAGFRPVERTVRIQANQEARLEVELRQVEEVAAASRSVESVQDAPSSVSVVSQQELRALGYPTIAEALRGVRGVFTSDDRSYATVGFRGFSRLGDYGNRVLVLIDGHPLNDNWMGSSYVGYDGRADIADIERLEVIRGPGSVLYGTGAFSGVINLVTRSGDVPTGGEVGTSASEYGVARGRGRVNLRLGPGSGLWLSVAGARGQGRDFYFSEYAQEGGWARGLDGFKAGTVQGRLWWKSFNLQWFFHSRDKQMPTAVYEMIFGDPRARMVDTRGALEARFEPKLSDKVQLLTRGHVNTYTFHGTYPYTEEQGGTMKDRYRGLWVGVESRALLSLSPSLRLTVGGELQHHFQAKQECATGEASLLDRSDPYQLAAVYALAEASLNSAVRFSGGTRLDWYSTFGSAVNPRAAVILHPYERGTIKILGGKAFRAPSIYELYYNDGGQTMVASSALTDNRGSTWSPLRPETLWSPEVEYSHRFTSAWVGLVAGYANYIQDLIVARGEGNESSPLHLENSRSPVLTTGGELELRREWRTGSMLTASYSYQHSSYVDAQEAGGERLRQVPNSPEHLASLKGAVPIVPKALVAAMRLSLEGPRYDRYDRDSDPAQGKTDAAVIWDIVFSGEAMQGKLRYAVGVYNAFDWRYSVPASSEYRQRTILQNGRTFLANLSSSF